MMNRQKVHERRLASLQTRNLGNFGLFEQTQYFKRPIEHRDANIDELAVTSAKGASEPDLSPVEVTG